MTVYTAIVKIDTDTAEHAETVLTERLGHDEDYGFAYSLPTWKLIVWRIQPWNADNTGPANYGTADRFATADEAEAHGRATYPHGVAFSNDDATCDATERAW